jgi:phenylacetate-coenzyme A ligase PaaK-like adenylate-forming protein
VRYRLNDILTLSPAPCACGSDFRVIAGIEGRCDDLFAFPTRAGAPRPMFPDLIRRMILLSSPDILDYQATQEQCGAIRIYLDVQLDVDWNTAAQALRRSVQETLATYDCVATTIEISRGLLPMPAGAKRRRVWRRHE